MQREKRVLVIFTGGTIRWRVRAIEALNHCMVM
jgi:hypothetical protein